SSIPSKYRPESVISHTNGLCNANTNSAVVGTQLTNSPGSNISGCTIPPARPPKPRNLTIDKTSPVRHNYTPVKTKISSQLKESIALFENGARSTLPNGETNGDKQSQINGSANSLEVDSTTAVPLTNLIGPPTTRQRDSSKPLVNNLEPAKTTTSGVSSPPRQSPLAKKSDTTQALTSNSCPVAPDSSETSSAKNHGNKNGTRDFIVQSDAFRVSPQFLNSGNLQDSLPTLQHAEPIAVATPDEEDDDPLLMFGTDDPCSSSLMPLPSSDSTSVNPTLPVPPGLKVVAVDNRGVHILEDGNFFYTVPGLSSRPQSPEDSDFLSSRSVCHPMSPGDDRTDTHATPTFSEMSSGLSNTTDPLPTADLSLLPDTSMDSMGRQPRVRFSTEPIVIYSTHSTLEYNRRNDDIDPLAASAEYELEKHLEEMEMVKVDLKKGPDGLGISILGLGVDNVGCHQKLGIFIKALTPGGAAEADGR
ncbi:Neurabin-1, partial [Fasciolopsis buskii]